MQHDSKQPAPEVAPRANQWTVKVTRALDARTASMTIVVATAPTAAQPAPNAEVAAAGAWFELAQASVGAGATTQAITAARAGIAELGTNYKPRGVKDDTTLKIGMADEHIDKGQPDVGARELISVLGQRVELYFEKYATVHRDK